jgi:molecular chaperone DnaJ
MSKDYYSILWVDRNASAEDIKKAYRKKAMDLHPDRHGGDKEKEAEFKTVNEAYAVLSDPQKKSRYDQFGSAEGGASGFGGMGGFDFGDINVEDIFSSVFGNMGGFGGGRRQARDEGGEDIQKEVHITFAESFSGIKKEIHFDKMVHCESCHGHGTKDGKEPKKCSTCHGSGHVTRATRSIFGVMQQTVVCDDCRGEWVKIDDPCKECHGKRRVKKKIEQTVEIPAGIDDGMTLRMTGEGHAGKHNSGNLYITCHVDQSYENLIRDGSNILTIIHISPAEAVLGVHKKIKFPLIGEREIRIAAGTQHGKKLQISGDGMSLIGKKWRGDLIITLEILIPGKLSKEEKKLYTELLETEKN